MTCAPLEICQCLMLMCHTVDGSSVSHSFGHPSLVEGIIFIKFIENDIAAAFFHTVTGAAVYKRLGIPSSAIDAADAGIVWPDSGLRSYAHLQSALLLQVAYGLIVASRPTFFCNGHCCCRCCMA